MLRLVVFVLVVVFDLAAMVTIWWRGPQLFWRAHERIRRALEGRYQVSIRVERTGWKVIGARSFLTVLTIHAVMICAGGVLAVLPVGLLGLATFGVVQWLTHARR